MLRVPPRNSGRDEKRLLPAQPAQKFGQTRLVIADLKGRLIWQTVNDERVFSDIVSDCTIHFPFHPLCFSCGAFPQVSVQAT